MDGLEDCPSCVPIVYKLRPDDSQCIWPLTPAPTLAPTLESEALGNGAQKRNGGGGGLVISYLVGIASSVVIRGFCRVVSPRVFRVQWGGRTL